MLVAEKYEFRPGIGGGNALTETLSGSAIMFVPGHAVGYSSEHSPLPDPEIEFDRIVLDPEICMGQPTIRGTRMTAAFVYRLMQSGMQLREIREAYPRLMEEDIRQAIAFCQKTKPTRTP